MLAIIKNKNKLRVSAFCNDGLPCIRLALLLETIEKLEKIYMSTVSRQWTKSSIGLQFLRKGKRMRSACDHTGPLPRNNFLTSTESLSPSTAEWSHYAEEAEVRVPGS